MIITKTMLSILDELELKHPDLWRRPMSTSQVAGEFCIHRSTVLTWIEEGRLPARRIGRNWRVPRLVVSLIIAGEMDIPDTR